jgi:uncharacterized protein
MDLSLPLDAAGVHVEGEDAFVLAPGGSLVCRVEKGDVDTVHVTGRLSAGLELVCGRCLEPYVLALAERVDLFCLPHASETGVTEDEEEIAERDIVVTYYGEDRVDLGEMVREQLLLTLPMKRVCKDSCLGLCAVCGGNRNTDPCDCAPPSTALSSLSALLGKGSSS